MSAPSPFPALHARAKEAATTRTGEARGARDRADAMLAEIGAILAELEAPGGAAEVLAPCDPGVQCPAPLP